MKESADWLSSDRSGAIGAKAAERDGKRLAERIHRGRDIHWNFGPAPPPHSLISGDALQGYRS